MAAYGELVLVVGDFHIPHRKADIPEKFRKILVPNKMQHVLCTGNLCTREQHDFLRTIAPNVHVVRGDMDEASQHLPEYDIVEIGEFRIGLCHGHQVVPWGNYDSLASFARALDVDILISGHTHVNGTTEHQRRWFINPGSITGASASFDLKPTKASFICMSIQGNVVVNYVYELNNQGEVEVTKTQFEKRDSSIRHEEEGMTPTVHAKNILAQRKIEKPLPPPRTKKAESSKSSDAIIQDKDREAEEEDEEEENIDEDTSQEIDRLPDQGDDAEHSSVLYTEQNIVEPDVLLSNNIIEKGNNNDDEEEEEEEERDEEYVEENLFDDENDEDLAL